jgi:hypothetical protein
MQRTVIVLVTHRGLADDTAECVAKLGCPSIIKVKGCPDQSKGRSMSIDAAFDKTSGTAIDTVLLLDDDQIFDQKTVLDLVEHSRTTQECCSGVTVTADGKLCARPLSQLVRIPGSPVRWLTGLGCLAVPRARLVKLRDTLPKTAGITHWCRSGPHPDYPGEWFPNDFWFCHHFGGVLLIPLAFGHLKFMPIWPDERMVRECCNYKPE